MKTFIKYLLVAVLIAGVGFLLFYFPGSCNRSSAPSANLAVTDSTTLARGESLVASDTVLTLLERVVKIVNDPVVIYKQRVDSVYLEQIRWRDLMTRVEKRGNNLRIFAVNEKDSIVKEFVFNDVYSDFTATSAVGNIFVKSNKYSFNGVSAFTDARSNFLSVFKTDEPFVKLSSVEYRAGLKTGVTYKDRLSLDGKLGYNLTNKTPFVEAELSLKFK